MDDRSKLVKSLSADELRRLMERLKKGQLGAERIGRASRDGAPLPLSFAQERLWFLDRLGANSSAYNVPAAVRLAGALDTPALRRTFTELVRRHESLRTTFAESDGVPFQVIAPDPATPLPVADLAGLPAGAREREMLRLATAEADRPFDLTRGPLVRTLLFRLGPAEHVLTVTLHHIVSDGWSTGVMIREMAVLYAAFTAGRPSPLPELPIQYADYAVWQRRRLSGETLDKELAFWRERLAGTPPLELPADRPRPLQMSFAGGHRGIEIEGALLAAANALCREAEGTLYMVLLAAFEALLLRYSGQADFAVGAPVANRGRSETEGLIGLFVNTLALRASLADGLTFRGLLERVKEGTLAAFAHEDMPFDKLVEELQPDREPGRNPLFQVITTLQNQPRPELAMGSLALSVLEVENATAKVDLTLAWTEHAGRLMGSVEYSSALFDGATAERLARHFQTLLGGAVANPGLTLWELPLLDGAERRQTLIDWNRTASDYPRESAIHELFEAEVERNPGAVAVEFETTRLTYAELNARANRLAHRLRRLGVGPEALVVLSIPRSLEMIEGMLGILKAGGAYLPLDPSLPRERLAFLVEESQPAALVTLEAHLDALPDFAERAVCLDRDRAGLDAERADAPRSGVTADNLVYVLYTSGSTGRPKAVAVPHRGLVRLVRGAGYARLDSGETFFQFAPLSFDPSTLEIFGALANGGRLAVAPAGPFSLSELGQVIRRHGVTTLWLTSGLFHQMIEEGLDDLRGVRQLLSGGDVLSPVHIRRALEALPGVEIIDGYGPTENSCFTTCYRVDPAAPPGAYVPIGRPVANTTVYILDRELRPVPAGIPGELLTGGDGLARGYRGRPELTAERFVPSPFAGETDPAGARLYRTGDLSRFRPDGDIEFLGRMDSQVKIRGYRIEPGEVEAVLAAHPALAECAVVVRREASGERRLVACYVAAEPVTPATLKEHLAVTLPAYMVPTAFLELPALPLTTSGKVDRRALSRLEVRAGDGPSEEYAEPRTPVERQIAAIWSDLLKRERIGLHDNFFDLGGHSLLATRVLSRLRESLSADLSLTTVFERPTLAGLAAAVEEARGTGPEAGTDGETVAAPGRALTTEERGQLAAWHRSPGTWAVPGSIHALFEEQARMRPEAVALVAGDQRTTYGELARRSGALALSLRRLGVGPEARVGLAAERSSELVAGILGILRAGATLVPLDLAHPTERLALLFEDSGLAAVVTQERLAAKLPAGGPPVLRLESVEDGSWTDGGAAVPDAALAYVIYTSGSTGRPKGVGVSHASMVPMLRWSRDTFGLGEGRRVLQSLSYAFDFGLWEILTTIVSGAALHIPPVEETGDPEAFARRVAAEGIDTVHATPSFFRAVAETGARLEGLRVLHLGGEALNRPLVERLASAVGAGCTLYNGYGPTEATVNSLLFEIGRPGALRGGERTPIGRPSAENAVYVVDPGGAEVPAGAQGELRIGGPGVARGYLGRPGLTAETFVPDAFGGEAGGRLYRTGDLARWLADGNVEFLGRVDDQVKIRGFRIEPGEIEAALRGYPGVREAVVVARERPGGQALVAYLLADPASATSGHPRTELREYLRGRLPAALVPSAFVRLDELPLTPSGKVDRRALPEPVFDSLDEGGEWEGPRTPVEVLLAGIFSELLGVARVGRTDSFFHLGGHSLMATRLLARVRRELRVDLPLQSLFEAATVAELAALIQEAGRPRLLAVEEPARSGGLPLSFAQERLWFLEQLQPGTSAYNIPAPVRLRGPLSPAALAGALEEVVRRHQILRVTLGEREGRAVQWVSPPAAIPFPTVDLSALPSEPREAEGLRVITGEARLPFDLQQGPLLRARLLRHASGDHVMILTIHHIAADGWSMGVLIRELLALYQAALGGLPSPFPEPARQYFDFGRWQRGTLQGETLERLLAYWRRTLAGLPEVLELPADRPRPPVRSFRGRVLRFSLDEAVTRSLHAAARETRTTMFMTLLAGFDALLARYSGQEDLAVGSAIANRNRGEDEGLIGFFVNTLVLRGRPAGGLTFRELLGQVRGTTLGAYEHQDLPFERIVEEVRPERSLAHSPLFQVSLTLQNNEMPAVALAGLTAEGVRTQAVTAKFDLSLFLEEAAGGLSGSAEYATDLFDKPTVKRLTAHLGTLLAAAAAAPETRLAELPLLDVDEHRQILSRRRAAAPPQTVQRADGPAGLTRRPPDGRDLPLSFSQERLWFLDRLEPGKAAYNIAVTVRMAGDLRVAALAATFNEILRRHEALRTAFITVEGAPRQRVLPFAAVAVPLIDLAGLPRPARDREASRVGQQYADWHFDLTRGPMLVAALLRVEPALHHCAAVFHHIASDGWSIGILFHEISVLYPALLEGRPSPLPELPIQYPDYALWQRREMAGTLQREVGYWMKQLGGEIAPLELPIDRPRPAIQSYRGASRTLILPPALGARLTALSHREGCTLFMTLLAAAKVLFHRQSGQDDILVGAPIAGRQRVETEELIGFFLNTLVLRTDLAGGPTFRELLARVRAVTLGAYTHQEVPFEALLARLPQQRDPSRTPLFQVMFNMLNMPDGQPIPLPGLTIEPFAVPELPSKFDLTFYVTDLKDEGIFFHLLYNADLFTSGRMEELLAQLAFLLEQAAEAPATPIEALSLVTPAALAALPDPAAPLDATWVGAIHDLFAARAATAPERTAIADREGTWSYGELETAGNRLANRLVAEGAGKGERVAIWVHRSAPVAVAVLGALKAGAAFTMLDPAYPPSRLVEILRVAAPRALVRLEAAGPLPDAVEAWLAEAGCRRADLPRGGAAAVLERLAGNASEPPAVSVGPDDVAVIGFTSGSTGTPKGIAGRHGPLTHFLPWQCERFGLSADDRFSLLSGLAHDPLQRDLFTPFYLGATIVVPNPEDIGVSGRLAAWMARERVTVAHLTPAMAQILTERASHGAAVETPGLRFVLLVGDALTRLDVARIRRLAPGVTCVNLYGSTETQRAVAYHVVEETGEDAKQVLPLGAGMKDAQLLVINRAGRLAGIGEVGEIAVRSPHLAQGYLGDAELTADKFRVNPFTNEAGDRIYRTGDLGRYLPDGEVTFAGRADLQVKIRGFRIEPAEIEARLAALPGVREAVVVPREERGEKRLVAYVVAEGAGTSATLLRQALRDRLPAYMVPSAFVLLDRLPITPNGKIDRRALPAPVEEAAEARGVALPESAVEETIAAVWREVLGVEKVGVNDNFFDVGGHSLLLVRLHSRLEEVLGREISLLELFNHPNIRSQADHLGGRAQALQPARRPEPAAAAEGSAGSGIAIVGLAGRFPEAKDVEELWRNLREGVEAISFFSTEEVVASTGLPAEAIADPRVVKARGVLAGEAMFDAEFFDVAPRQAELMDPQLRHFLECSWEALENAGYDPARFPGQIGVYGGVTLSSYFLNNLQSNPRLILEMGTHQTAVATDRDFLTTQVSYKLNLRGPSLTVQTACSTSLVATHLACLSLLAGECDMALAGGVSIKVPQVTGYLYQEGGLDSSDGHCRSFDARADGSVYGSGVGVVVLKRLEDALADGDTVRAVILGSAINNDGSAKVGFTAPSIEGQSRAIAEAHAAAGIAPESIGYVECHGSGTALGDPIEVAALTRAFATPERGFCPIGSVKSSIGHLGAAAGIAGLIKTVLALEHGQIPPSLHFETPNPRIDFAASPFFVNTRLADWPADRGPRRAGVSSFGIGGTNAHAVLEEAPPPEPSDPGRPWQLLVLSARSESALEAASDNLAGWLERNPGADLADVAHTLQVGRQAFAWRRMLVCHTADEAARALAGRDPRVLRTAHTESGGRAPVALLFPGVGGYDPGMASGLQESEPVFRAELGRCLGILEEKLGEDPARFAEPLLFAFEYALARLWESWGVRPGAMAGDGVGEIVAACLAGGLPLEEALDRVADRARGIGEPPAVPPAPLAEALEELWKQPSRVLLEVGPGEALTALALQQPGAAGRVAIPSLPPDGEGRPGAARIAEALGRLWLAGVEIDWSGGFHAGERRRRLPLPTYPFERRRFWVAPDRESLADRDRPESWLHAPTWRRTPPPSAPGVPGARIPEVLVAIGDAAGALVPRLRERLAGAGRAPERTVRLNARADLENGGLALALRELGALAGAGELVILAEGLHELSGGDLRPEHAALAAACRRSAREQGIPCRVIDLPPFLDPLDRWAERLGAEIAYGTGESISYAPRGGRWVCSLERTRGGGPGLDLPPGAHCFLLARGGDGLAEIAESWLTGAGVEALRIEEPGPPPLEIPVDAPAPLGVVVVAGGGTVADAGRRLRAAREIARRTGGFCLVLADTGGGPEAEGVAAYAGLFALRESQGPDLLPWRSVIFEGGPPPASRGSEALLHATALGAPEVIVRFPTEPSLPGLPLPSPSAPVAPPDARDLVFSQLKGIL